MITPKSKEIYIIQKILDGQESVKLHVDTINESMTKLSKLLADEEMVILSNKIRAKVQGEAEIALSWSNDWGAVYMATGSGKSKIAVDKAKSISKEKPDAKILLSVPTEILRDKNWYNEFVKWDADRVWENNVERTCYASLNKYEEEEFDLVILDEGHNITEDNSIFFQNNVVKRVILLTATKPTNEIKLSILKSLKIEEEYSLSLDESVKLWLVAPYDITVITMQLDGIDKYIKAGSKDKPFMTTEKGQYGYLSTRLKAMPNSMGFINRMRFIYNLKSKTEAAKAILENVIPKDLRTLIFCGSKEQANALCEYRYYSKPTPPKKLPKKTTPAKTLKYEADMLKYQAALKEYKGNESFDLFINSLINRMSCVEALNEGHNIPNLDVGFIVRLNSSQQDLTQIIGRLIRFRAGYRGKIIILITSDTIEKEWLEKATAGFNKANITFIELSRLRLGLEKISFD